MPLPDAGEFVLRLGRYKAEKDADLVRAYGERPLFVFAGIWTTWRGVRGPRANTVDGEHRLYGFLTTDANGIVGRSIQGHAGAAHHGRGVRRVA